MRRAKKVIVDVSSEFEKLTGRKYDLFEEYKTDDAEVAVVVLNSTAGTAKFVADEMRNKGIKVGVIKPRVFRPFPVDEIAKSLSRFKAVAVLDKVDGFNAAGGPLFTDIAAGLYANSINNTRLINYTYGLGGRDVDPSQLERVYNELKNIASTGKVESVYNYLGVRE